MGCIKVKIVRCLIQTSANGDVTFVDVPISGGADRSRLPQFVRIFPRPVKTSIGNAHERACYRSKRVGSDVVAISGNVVEAPLYDRINSIVGQDLYRTPEAMVGIAWPETDGVR